MLVYPTSLRCKGLTNDVIVLKHSKGFYTGGKFLFSALGRISNADWSREACLLVNRPVAGHAQSLPANQRAADVIRRTNRRLGVSGFLGKWRTYNLFSNLQVKWLLKYYGKSGH